MKYQVVKTYGHHEGMSCTFRQWRADHSHCRYIHGYAIGVELTFECQDLDSREWCLDFGSLGPIKEWLKSMFDHKTLVAEDDPHIDDLMHMAHLGLMDVVYVPAVGCEKFAEMIYARVKDWLDRGPEAARVTLRSVRVSEHSGNSALYDAD